MELNRTHAAVALTLTLTLAFASQALWAQTATTPNLGDAQALNGQHIRAAEARLDNDFGLSRYTLIDAALLENAALIEQARAASNAPVLLRLRRDRIVALRDRGLMPEAIADFNALAASGQDMPAYVLSAAADAHLQQRQPEQARLLYRRVLEQDPGNAAAKSGLLFAEVEAENFPAAEDVVDGMLTESQRGARARRTQVMVWSFADRLDEAEAALRQLTQELPDDAGIWQAQGDLFSRRGLPRAAAARYRAVLAIEPSNIRARVGLAEALWAQGAIPEAAAAVAALQADAPEHPAVQRLLRAWQRSQRPLLTSGATKGFGQGHVSGNDDLIWESTLYSGMHDAGWRLFGTHHLAQASFNGRSANHERVGMGFEWTQRDWQLAAEAGRDLRNGQDAWWSLAAAHQIDDHWSVRARYESQTNDFPLKGRLPDAENYLGAPSYLHANKALLGGAYRVNESRRLAADYSHYDFNDGNRRQALSASWFERLYSGYGRTLDLQTAVYTSSNTLRDAFYFNPQRDYALSATLTGDWLTWRRYERSFNQRLAVTLGSYRQESDVQRSGVWGRQRYGWNAFQDARYEHEWQWGPDFNARYGIGVRRFPYDGVYETKGYVFVHMSWRF